MSTDKNTKDAILPIDTRGALQFMFDISEQLCDLSDKEREEIDENNFVGLALLQERKKSLAERYALAAVEFKDRIEEFRKTDKSRLGALQNLQKELGEKARANASVLDIMLEKLQQNTHTTLLNVQMMAQEGRASYNSVPSDGMQEPEPDSEQQKETA